MDIEKQTKDVMLNAISNFSKEYEVSDLETQLMIRANDSDCTPKYQVLVNNKFKKDVTFNEILNNITILNGSATNSITLAVSGSAENISLGSGQTLTLNASTGFSLPDLTLSGTGLTANVVTS